VSAVIVHRDSDRLAHRTGSGLLRRARRSVLLAVAGLTALGSFGLIAYAYWSGNDSKNDLLFAQADALGKGATPIVTSPGTPLVASSVHLGWAVSTLSSGAAVDGYLVKRYPVPSGPAVSVGAGCSGTISSLDCTETNVADGTWTYTVTPVIGNNWVGTESNRPSATRVGTTELVITSSPVSLVAGSISSEITVERRDSAGNPTLVGTRTVGLTTTSVNGNFRDAGTVSTSITSVTIPDGASAVTFRYYDTKAGSPTITAASVDVTSATQQVTVTAGVATTLSFTTSPGDSDAGQLLSPQPVVTIQDAFGNTATGATNSVSLSGATFATTPTTCTSTRTLGVVTFAGCRINTSGPYTLSATSFPTLTIATSNSFTVAAGSPAQLAYGLQPSSAVAGVNQSTAVTVFINDAYGNLTTSTANVSVSLVPSATLFGSNTQNAVAGTATFAGLSVQTAGSYVLRASATLGSLITIDSAGFVISPAGTDRVVFTTAAPSGTTTDASTSAITVQRQDPYGNATTNGATAITFTSNSGSGVFRNIGDTANITGMTIPALTSTASFRYRDTVKGSRTITVGSDYPNITQTFAIAAGAIDHLTFTQPPAAGTAGLALATQPIVTIFDANNNIVDGASNKVSLAIATGPSGSTLTGTLCAPGINALSGVATFTDCRIDKAGTTYTLTATITSPAKTITSSLFTVVAGTGSTLAFGTVPSTAVAGNALSAVSVLINDSFGNLSTSNALVTVVIGTNGGTPAGSLSGSVTANAVAGTATFTTLSLNKVGTYTLVATGSGLTPSPASSDIVVTAGAVSTVTFLVQPASPTGSATAGAAFVAQPSVLVEDANSNPVAGTAVVLTANTASIGFSCSSSPVTTNLLGVASFSGCVITKSGTYTLTATAGSPAKTGTSGNIVVNAGAVSTVSFLVQPASPAGLATAGSAFVAQPSVSLVDSFSNPVVGTAVDLTANTPLIGFSCSSSSVTTNLLGVASFSGCVITKSGTHSLTATAGSPVKTATSSDIVVSAGAVSSVTFATPPAGGIAGQAFGQPTVLVADGFGNPIVLTSVSLAPTPSAGIGFSCASTITNGSGLATFSGCLIQMSGSYTLKATAGLVTSAASSAFTITAAAPVTVSLSLLASSNVAGVAFSNQPSVTVTDVFGNVVSGATISMSVSGGGATVVGCAGVTTNASGVATLSGCNITKTGVFNLIATASTTTPVGSASSVASTNTVTITAAAPVTVSLSLLASSNVAGVAFTNQPSVTVTDVFGNVVSGATISMSVSGGGATVVGCAGTTTNASGVATLSGCNITKTGVFNLIATASTTTPVGSASSAASTNTVTITAAAPVTLVVATCKVNGGVSSTSCAGPFLVGGAPGFMTFTVNLVDAFNNASSALVTATSGDTSRATVSPASSTNRSDVFTVTKVGNGNNGTSISLSAGAAPNLNVAFTVQKQ
jgi:trimeric autotransporter adhesin